MKTKWNLLIVLVLLSVLLVIPVPAQAATCTVTNGADSGGGTLRALMADSNCTTILFAGDYTVRVASTLTIARDLTINGTGHDVTISGDTTGNGSGDLQIFNINPGVTASLMNLTVTKGNCDGCNGGAVYNDGNLAVIDSIFSDNGGVVHQGGAIYNNGTLEITNSTFSGNKVDIHQFTAGGAIYNNGSMTVTSSTFSGNFAWDSGGGISNWGSLTVTNSTFSGNTTYWIDYTLGGGIYNSWSGTLSVTNSTLSRNTNGNISSKNGRYTIRNTLYVNGNGCWGAIDGSHNLSDGASCGSNNPPDTWLGPIGIYGGGTQTFPLLPGSAAIDGGDDAVCPATDQRGMPRPIGAHCDIGAFESQGFTMTPLTGTPQSAIVNTAFVDSLSLKVTPKISLEPVNGGWVTFTAPASGASALITGSRATITAGTVAVTATANTTQGSYNVTASSAGANNVYFALTNLPSAITVTNPNDSGPGSLRQALLDTFPGGTITFAGDFVIHLASTLTIDRDLTIDGAGHSITISGDTTGDDTGDVRAFLVNPGVTVNLKHLTITKGYCKDCEGGGINNSGTLAVSNLTLSDNIAKYGAGVYNTGSLTIANSTFSSNSAFSPSSSAGFGGCIYNLSGMLTVMNSTFANNSAVTQSGCILSWGKSQGTGAMTIITNSTFSGNNTPSHNTEALDLEGGSANVRNSIFVKDAPSGNCSFLFVAAVGTNNLSSDDSCSSVNATKLDSILLGTLGNNGGSTPTYPLLPGSAAIDQGNTSVCQDILLFYSGGFIDQRGYNRFADGPDGDTVAQCDIGSYEYGSSSVVQRPVNDTTPPVVTIQKTPETPDGANSWYRQAVTLQPTATDEFEIIELRCTLDPPTAPATYTDLPEQLCPFLAGAPVSTDGSHTFYAAAMDIHGNQSEVVSASFQIDATPPVLTCPVAGPFLLHSGDQPVGPAEVDASVSGSDEVASTLSVIVTTDSVGSKSLIFTAFDLAGHSASQDCSYNVIYDFAGFYPPVEPAPALNTAKAGSAVPLKFSLASEQGLEVIAAGSPASQPVFCDNLEPSGPLETAQTAGQSGLSYDPLTSWYNYAWRTDKDWVGTCQALTIELLDGTQHLAYFQFQ